MIRQEHQKIDASLFLREVPDPEQKAKWYMYLLRKYVNKTRSSPKDGMQYMFVVILLTDE